MRERSVPFDHLVNVFARPIGIHSLDPRGYAEDNGGGAGNPRALPLSGLRTTRRNPHITTPATVHEPSLLQFSSGTTGEPKLIARRWRQIGSEIDSYNRKLAPSSMDRPLILVPVSHSYGLITGLLAGMAREAEPIVVHSKNPKFSLHMIQTTENSLVYAVPFLYHLLNTLGKDELKYHKLISSGAPLNETLLARLKGISDEVWQQYGCTETGCVSLGTQLSDYTDVGTPLDDLEVSMASDGTGVSSADLPSEIIVSGGAGRVHTKDVGFWSEGGRLHLSGRMDDLINLSGLKVIPAEVERVMERMPGVEEAVVFRMNHAIWGEAVQALAVVSGAVSQNDLRQWCIEHLPAYKVPSAIRIVKEIPKSAAGKISRKYLCEMERTRNGATRDSGAFEERDHGTAAD